MKNLVRLLLTGSVLERKNVSRSWRFGVMSEKEVLQLIAAATKHMWHMIINKLYNFWFHLNS